MQNRKPLKKILCVWLILLLVAAGVFYFCFGRRQYDTYIMIDPGHGGYDSGAVGADNATYEKDITMKIAYKVGQQIQSLDPEIGILFTRTDDNVSWPADETADLLARITMAQEQNADYFLSIHLNSSTNPEAYGYHSFVRSNDPFSQDVADRIAANLEKNKYSYDRETVFTDQAPLMVVDNLSIPSLLFEVGFISNYDEMSQLKNPFVQDQIAKAIASAYVDTIHDLQENETNE